MMRKRLLVFAVILLFSAVSAGESFARMGGGRSSGSRGSRGMSAPYRPSSPRPSTPYQQGAAPSRQMPGGGFFRSMAAGMAGGLLGGLLSGGLSGCGSRPDRQDGGAAGLDNSAAGTSGTETSGGDVPPNDKAAGGMSFFDIILLAGLAFLVYRYFMKRRMQRQQPGPDSTHLQPPLSPVEPGSSSAPFPFPMGDAGGADPQMGIGRIRQMDPSFDEKAFHEQATDLFFRLQGAWTRRDLAPVQDLLTAEMRGVLQADVNGMKAKGQVNRLENIAVRTVEISEAWQESGEDYVTVRFLASLLDYTTDDAGKVLSGSDTTPVKFEEFWTLTRPVGPGAWKLSAIRQP